MILHHEGNLKLVNSVKAAFVVIDWATGLDSIYHGLWSTSCGVLAGKGNSLMGPL